MSKKSQSESKSNGDTSARELVRRLHTLDPHMSGADMARIIGCSRARTSELMSQEFGPGRLKRFLSSDSLHLNLGRELRAQLPKAAEDHESISEWCRAVLSLACYLQVEGGVDPVVILGMKAKEVEGMKSFEHEGGIK